MPPEKDTGSSRFPGGGKLVGLILLLLVVLAGLVWNPGRGGQDSGGELPDVLAGLGDSGDELDRIGGDLGTPGLLEDDEPLDLGVPSSEGLPTSPATRVSPVATREPTRVVKVPEPTPPIPVPTAPATREPATPEPTAAPTKAPTAGTGSLGQLRPIDYARAWTAYKAGDAPYLTSIFRDESYRAAGRVFTLTLAGMLPGGEVPQALQEVFETTSAPFVLRESAGYVMLARGREAFGDYLVRVLERPRVASGEDQEVSRLVLLAFQADRYLFSGRALDRVGDKVLDLARSGSPTAVAALSFGLSPESPMDASRDLIEARRGSPPVADNLLRFYRAMVDRGRKEFQAPMAALKNQQSSGL